jgi:hypothetical protein
MSLLTWLFSPHSLSPHPISLNYKNTCLLHNNLLDLRPKAEVDERKKN